MFNRFSCHAKGSILVFFAMIGGLERNKPNKLLKAAFMAVGTFGIDGGAQEARSGEQPKAMQAPVKAMGAKGNKPQN